MDPLRVTPSPLATDSGEAVMEMELYSFPAHVYTRIDERIDTQTNKRMKRATNRILAFSLFRFFFVLLNRISLY